MLYGVLLWINTLPTHAQTTLPTELLPIREAGKWGYIDLEGKVVLKPNYEYVSVFRAGKAIAQQNGRLGVIDRKGNVLLPFNNLNLDTLANDYFATRNEAGKWGVIKINGQIIVPVEADKIVARLCKINNQRENKILFEAYQQKKASLYDTTGKCLSPTEYDSYEFLTDSIIVRRKENKVGLIDINGIEILPTEYDRIVPFEYTNGFITIQKEKKVGLMNLAGKLIFTCEYDYIKPMGLNSNSGVIRRTRATNTQFEVGKNGFKGLWNTSFQEIVPIQYESIEFVANKPDFLFVSRYGKYGIYNIKIKKEIIAPEYNHVLLLTDELALLRQEKNGMVLTGAYNFVKDKVFIPIQYNYLEAFTGGGQTFFLTAYLATYTVFDVNGKIITKNLEIDDITFDDTGIFLIRKNTRWGLLNNTVFIKPTFDGITNFKRNVAMVRIDNLYGLINIRGQFLMPIRYKEIKMHGYTARAINGQGGTDVYTFDNQGNLIDKVSYQQKIKTLNIKKTESEKKIETEWEFDMERPVTARTNRSTNPAMSNVRLRRTFNIPNRSTNAFTVGSLTVAYHPTKEKWYALKQNDTIFKPVWEYVNENTALGLMQVVEIVEETKGEDKGKKNPYWGLLNANTNVWIYKPTKFAFDITFNLLEDYKRGEVGRTPLSFLRKDGKAVGGIKVQQNGKTETKNIFYCEPFATDSTYANLALFNSGGYLIDRKALLIRLNILDGTWGLMRRDGTAATPPLYQNIWSNNGLFFTDKAHKEGVLDSTGKEIIPNEYDGIAYLRDNRDNEIRDYLLLSKNVERYGFLDSMRYTVINTQYKRVQPFSDGYAAVMRDTLVGKEWKGVWTFIDIQGKEIHPFAFREVRPFSEGLASVKIGQKWGYLNAQGQIAIEPTFSQAQDFHEGKAVVREFLTGKLMYIDKTGTTLSEMRFEKASDFQQNIAIAKDFDKKLLGLLTDKMQWLIPPQYAEINPFNEQGYALYKSELGNEIGLLDRKGREITKAQYHQIEPFEQGLARVGKQGEWNFIDTTGKELFKQNYRELYHFEGNLCLARTDEGWGYLGRQGDWVIKPQFERATPFSHGTAEVKAKGSFKSIFIDTLGLEVGKPKDWYTLGDLEEYAPDSAARYVRVKRDGRWGYWDKQRQKMFTAPIYKYASAFYNGYAKVIDLRGNVRYVSEQKHTLPALPNGVRWLNVEQDNFKTVRKNGLYGFATIHDFIYSTPKFGYLGELKEGRIPVAIYKLYGVADREGNVLLKPIYEQVTYMGKHIFRVELNDCIGYWHKTKGWLWEARK